jgi:hypothetical protein
VEARATSAKAKRRRISFYRRGKEDQKAPDKSAPQLPLGGCGVVFISEEPPLYKQKKDGAVPFAEKNTFGAAG